MTGTISANRPYDLWNQIRFLDGGRALDMEYDEAKKLYDLPRTEEDAEGFPERMADLHARIEGFTIRETKETAGVELPPKNFETWDAVLESRQRVLYDEYEQAARVLIEKDGAHVLDDNSEVLKTLGRLVECAAYPMGIDEGYEEEPGKDEVLDEVLQQRVKGRKAIIWTGFRGQRGTAGGAAGTRPQRRGPRRDRGQGAQQADPRIQGRARDRAAPNRDSGKLQGGPHAHGGPARHLL